MNTLDFLIITVGTLTAVGIISSIRPSTKNDTYHTQKDKGGRFQYQYERNHHVH